MKTGGVITASCSGSIRCMWEDELVVEHRDLAVEDQRLVRERSYGGGDVGEPRGVLDATPAHETDAATVLLGPGCASRRPSLRTPGRRGGRASRERAGLAWRWERAGRGDAPLPVSRPGAPRRGSCAVLGAGSSYWPHASVPSALDGSEDAGHGDRTWCVEPLPLVLVMTSSATVDIERHLAAVYAAAVAGGGGEHVLDAIASAQRRVARSGAVIERSRRLMGQAARAQERTVHAVASARRTASGG